MTPSSAGDTTRTAQVVREALDAVAAPVMRDAILREALARAVRSTVPETFDRLEPFVRVHLREVVVEALGVEVAEQIVTELLRLVHAMSLDEEVSQVRPATSIPAAPRAPMDLAPTRKHAVPNEPARGEGLIGRSGGLPRRHSGNELPTEPAPGLVPVVLLASRDHGTLDDLRNGLTGGLEVVAVDDPIALLDALQSTECLAVIVVDARHPSVQPATMAAMAPDLPEGVQVVLWGVTPELEREINSLNDGTVAWVGCDAETPPEEVAFLCLTMLRDLG